MNQRDDRRREPAELYDFGGPLDPERFLDGFTEEAAETPVDPSSPLGRAMAGAREAWARPDYEPIDPATWTVVPTPVAPSDE